MRCSGHVLLCAMTVVQDIIDNALTLPSFDVGICFRFEFFVRILTAEVCSMNDLTLCKAPASYMDDITLLSTQQTCLVL